MICPTREGDTHAVHADPQRNAEDFARRTDPAQAGDYWGGWTAFIGAMAQAGVIVKGDGLQGPHAATTLRIRDGKRVVEDGPFADTKEQLGGYFVIEVPTSTRRSTGRRRRPPR